MEGDGPPAANRLRAGRSQRPRATRKAQEVSNGGMGWLAEILISATKRAHLRLRERQQRRHDGAGRCADGARGALGNALRGHSERAPGSTSALARPVRPLSLRACPRWASVVTVAGSSASIASSKSDSRTRATRSAVLRWCSARPVSRATPEPIEPGAGGLPFLLRDRRYREAARDTTGRIPLDRFH